MVDNGLQLWSMELNALRAMLATGHVPQRVQKSWTATRNTMVERQSSAGGTVAVIKILGAMTKGDSWYGGTSTVRLRRELQAASVDPGVDGILLAIDSPGGSTAGTDDLAAEVRAAKRGKPVWAHIDDLGASAAYWIASQATRVFANNKTALVGSIGTLLTIYDTSAADEKEGVKALVFSTGSLKGAGTPGTVITPEQASYFQGLVNNAQAEFDAAVKRGRNMSDKQLDAVRSGAIWTATTAQALGLIDGIQPLAVTMAQLARAGRINSSAGGAR